MSLRCGTIELGARQGNERMIQMKLNENAIGRAIGVTMMILGAILTVGAIVEAIELLTR